MLQLNIAKRIRELRKLHRMTQDELAERAGLTRQSISDLERGQYQPRNSTIEALAESFNMDIESFIQVHDSNGVVTDFTNIVKELAHSNPDLMISFKELSNIIHEITSEDKIFLSTMINTLINRILQNHSKESEG